MDITKEGFVYKTTDYDLLESVVGNRAVLEDRKKRIMKSIKERGWIMNPIVVNELYKIIDGSGRYEALKELQMPVYFVIAKGATIDDCIALNIKQANWKTIDYINCYAELGYEDYIELKKLLDIYIERLGSEGVTILASNRGNAGGLENYIKTGDFKIIDREHIRERFEYAVKFFDIVGTKFGRARTWIIPLKFAYFSPRIDHELLMEKVIEHQAFLKPAATIEQSLSMLEKIYNYRMPGNKKIYFVTEYDQEKCKRNKTARKESEVA